MFENFYSKHSKKHYLGEGVYSLHFELDIINAFLKTAVANFCKKGFSDPVNAIELGYWLEGSRLMIFFLHQVPYVGAGEATYDEDRIIDDGKRKSFAMSFDAIQWEMMHSSLENRSGISRILDIEGNPVELDRVSIRKAIAKLLLAVVQNNFKCIFDGVHFADVTWITAFEDSGNFDWDVIAKRGDRFTSFPELNWGDTPENPSQPFTSRESMLLTQL